MSIVRPVVAKSVDLTRLIASKPFLSVRSLGRALAKRFPRPNEMAVKRAEEYARGLLTGGTLFEELGFFYVGPIDGHNEERRVGKEGVRTGRSRGWPYH